MSSRIPGPSLLTALAVSGALAGAVGGQTPAADVEFFEKRVRPVLVETCYRCHSAEADKLKGGLRVDSREALLLGGDLGPAVVVGQPEQSRLITAITWGDPELQMPPKKKLSPTQIADLTEWVRRGAPWPAEDTAVAPVRKRTFEVTEKDRQHWAFRPVGTPIPPTLPGRSGVHPIDAFIEARLVERGVPAAPEADPRALFRRLHYDLLGLPPSPEDVEAFARDPSPQAWEGWVDRLLRSPHYGEKWARHWLDLVRFAETNSYEQDDAKPHAWRYRDYVIRAFNADKPYDQFVREQLAGDELPGATDETRIATGYYRLGIWDGDPPDKALARYDELDDLVATTGQVFLGLTIDCARCHDHKIDPIGQRDYYSLLAFFQNVNSFKNGGPTDEVLLSDPAEPRVGTNAPAALVVSEPGVTPPNTHVLLRGSPENLGDRVEPAFLQVLSPPPPRIDPPASGKSSGRRLALAQWLASPDNPLAARVMVNRVWQYHFGRGLVRSPSDFGLQGAPPTHPELLDWLAHEFVTKGWSLKKLHRLILTSQTYRRSTTPSPEALARDPGNDLWSHFDMRRLTAEEVRDSLLWVSGPVNRKMFGPGFYLALPPEVLAGQSVPGKGWGKSPAEEQIRRSIYIHVKRSLLVPLLLNFDLAEPDRSTPVRFSTTQPTQALGLLNSAWMQEQAARLAARLRQEAGTELAEQVRRAWSLVTGRPATADEVRRGVTLMSDLQQSEGASPEAALVTFCLLALNLNEFLYLN